MSKPIFAIAMLITFPGFSQEQTVNGFDKLLYISAKDSLPYRFLRPEISAKEKEFPLIIFLHGAGERGNDNEVQIKHITRLFLDRKNRKQFSCFVLAPQCPPGKTWAAPVKDGSRLRMRPEPTQPMAMLIELITRIEQEFPIDKSRIYVTGLSMGGFGTWDLIARFPHRFAAAVPICGGGDPEKAALIKHLPIWAFHGALDRVVPPEYSRNMIKALREVGAAPGYTEYPDIGHDSWSSAFRDPHLLPWMFDQSLGNTVELK
jgi:predicted peptidase